MPVQYHEDPNCSCPNQRFEISFQVGRPDRYSRAERYVRMPYTVSADVFLYHNRVSSRGLFVRKKDALRQL